MKYIEMLPKKLAEIIVWERVWLELGDFEDLPY
jgi:hypothetical protein